MATVEGDYKMSNLCAPSEYKPQESVGEAEDGRCRSHRKPRRILHFSDGVIEEYSTDEEDEEEEERKKLTAERMRVVDPKTMKWGPWLYYWLQYSGSSALSFCDYVGESLANSLGITSPKYQYELDEYNASLEQERAEKEEEDAQMAGWTTTAAATTSDGIKHKIVDTTTTTTPTAAPTLQEPVQAQSIEQLDIQLDLMKTPQQTKTSSHIEPSLSHPPSHPSSSSFSFTTSFKYWMSELNAQNGLQSSWV